jgi:hypothetical protein
MTQEIVRARVCWVTKAEGGREKPPTSSRYVAPARFDKEKDRFPAESWSLVLYLSNPPDEYGCSVADVRFLSPAGPSRLLQTGSKFELFDGPNVVARGEFL